MRTIWITIVYIFIVVLTSSFLFFNSKTRDYEDIANEIRAQAGKKLAEKHKMAVVGISGGMMESVNLIGISFQTYRAIDRNEIRYILIDCVEELLKAINESEEIRSYLKNFPFTTNNIRIEMFISDTNGRWLYDPNIGVASISEDNKIYYYTTSPNAALFKNKYEELYEEALAIVKGDPKKYPLGLAQQNEKVNSSLKKRKCASQR
jgi:hypothetical protein